MLSPKSKKRFRRYTLNLFHRSSSTPVLEDKRKLEDNEPTNNSFLSPRTPQAFRKIEEEEIERVKRLPCGGGGCKLWVVRVNGWSCCLKEIALHGASKSEINEFEKEVNVISKITKPTKDITTHLVQFLGCQRTSNALQLFMTLYEGNLFEVLGKLHFLQIPVWLEETRVARYASQLLHGLNILHNQNIIHRDIKSPNIFYTALESSDGIPRHDLPTSGIFPESLVLGDFGEAKILHEHSKAKTCRGTTSWIAPEVLSAGLPENNSEYSLAADIWSLAMVIYEMMTLIRPYSDVSNIRAFYYVQEGILPTLDEQAYNRYPRIIKVWHRMVKYNPSERPKAAELLLLFRDISESPNPKNEYQKESSENSDLDEETSSSNDDSSSTESIHMVEK